MLPSVDIQGKLEQKGRDQEVKFQVLKSFRSYPVMLLMSLCPVEQSSTTNLLRKVGSIRNIIQIVNL